VKAAEIIECLRTASLAARLVPGLMPRGRLEEVAQEEVYLLVCASAALQSLLDGLEYHSGHREPTPCRETSRRSSRRDRDDDPIRDRSTPPVGAAKVPKNPKCRSSCRKTTTPATEGQA